MLTPAERRERESARERESEREGERERELGPVCCRLFVVSSCCLARSTPWGARSFVRSFGVGIMQLDIPHAIRTHGRRNRDDRATYIDEKVKQSTVLDVLKMLRISGPVTSL